MGKNVKAEAAMGLLMDDMSKARSVYSLLLSELFEANEAPVMKFQYDYAKFRDLAQVVMDYIISAADRVQELDAMNTESVKGAQHEGL